MAKEILYIDLNYSHRMLSPKTRFVTMFSGAIILATGIWCILSYDNNAPMLASGILNIIVGTLAFLFSQRRLPNFAKKFIRLSENSIKIKNTWFIPRHKFVWDDIERIVISRESIKITTDYSSKTKVFDLMAVSYDDYNVLHKQMVDNCLSRNIDMI